MLVETRERCLIVLFQHNRQCFFSNIRPFIFSAHIYTSTAGNNANDMSNVWWLHMGP